MSQATSPSPATSGDPSASDAVPGVVRTLLPCGLRVVTEQVPAVRSVSIGVWIGAGSRDETPDEAGAAHYLEHLLFKGTRRRTAAAIAEEIDAVGGELNAFTAKEHTCFYAHVLDADLPLAVDLLGDVVTDAAFHPADVELERRVVLEEIAMRDDDPEDLLGDLFDDAVFCGHPLARPVIGSEESVQALSGAALRGFWSERYRPPNMVVAAAGNLEHDHVVALVEELVTRHGDGPAEPVPPRRGTGAAPASPVRLALRTADSEQAHLMLGGPALDRHDPRRSALGVLNAALGGGMSSRLFQQVREQRGLVYSVYSTAAGYADAGSFAVYAGCAPERLGELVTVVLDVLAGVARDGLTAAELARAQGAMRGGLVLGSEDTPSRMNRLGRSELDHARQRTIAESLAKIEAVTADDVAGLAAELLDRPQSAAVVGPFDDLDALPEPLRALA